MSNEPNKFYLTTPIYYVNARPHIGHAYTTIVADVLARRHRLLGDDTFFLTGTDEHGQKIERSAAAAGIPPQQFADQVSKSFEDLWKRMGITNDRYIRTTDPAHQRGAQKLFADLYSRGQIYLSSYTGQYSIGEEMFVEGPPGTIGPDGKPTETVTEENFFFRLSDYQLPLLNLIESGELVITPDSVRNEVLSFLRGNVDAFRDLTIDPVHEEVKSVHFEAIWDASKGEHPTRAEAEQLTIHHGRIKRSAAGEWFVPGALRDLSISRSSFTWGIPVPDDILRAAGTTQPHVIYVWLDALANYMTAVGYGSDSPSEKEKFKHYWPADLHLVGKEITRFHCVYWPAFLLALNPKLQHESDEEPPVLSLEEHKAWAKDWLPKQITAHGWLLFDNSKMSKSKGNIVRTETILHAFGTLCPPVHLAQARELPGADLRKGTASAVPPAKPGNAALAAEVRPPTSHERDLFAADVLRYYLLREIPFGQDGSFSFDALITRYNADLANGYGNTISRVANMIQQYFDGFIPIPDYRQGSEEQVSTEHPDYFFHPSTLRQLETDYMHVLEKASAALSENDFAYALFYLISFCGSTDTVLSHAKPWKRDLSAPQERAIVTNVLYFAIEAMRILTASLYPILPYATTRVWSQLGLGDIEVAARNGELNNLQWGGLEPGTKLGPLAPIFPRADKGLVQIMNDMEEQNAATPRDSKLTTELDPAQPVSEDSSHPGAPPSTGSRNEPAGPLPVGGSTALSTGPQPIPSHTEVAASGIFANHPPSHTVTAAITSDSPSSTAQISIDDFAKIELRVAQILVAERIPKADKLLRLEVDLGYEKRQILSGIAEFYAPEELIGRRIVVITNLAPRKMRGLESHGMLLAASEDKDGKPGKPILATMAEDIALGSRLK